MEEFYWISLRRSTFWRSSPTNRNGDNERRRVPLKEGLQSIVSIQNSNHWAWKWGLKSTLINTSIAWTLQWCKSALGQEKMFENSQYHTCDQWRKKGCLLKSWNANKRWQRNSSMPIRHCINKKTPLSFWFELSFWYTALENDCLRNGLKSRFSWRIECYAKDIGEIEFRCILWWFAREWCTYWIQWCFPNDSHRCNLMIVF